MFRTWKRRRFKARRYYDDKIYTLIDKIERRVALRAPFDKTA